jgi:hypothetical protein
MKDRLKLVAGWFLALLIIPIWSISRGIEIPYWLLTGKWIVSDVIDRWVDASVELTMTRKTK